MTNEKMEQETQGKTEKDNINQDKQQTQPTELVSPKAGTATSSPRILQVLRQIKCSKRQVDHSKHVDACLVPATSLQTHPLQDPSGSAFQEKN
jgi:hypothetical protein